MWGTVTSTQGSTRDAQVDTLVEAEKAIIADAERKIEKTEKTEKTRSQKFEMLSLISGMVVAALGFRFFGQIAHVVNAEPVASSLFYVADVGLSGVLIGGGSSFIDDVIVFLRKP